MLDMLIGRYYRVYSPGDTEVAALSQRGMQRVQIWSAAWDPDVPYEEPGKPGLHVLRRAGLRKGQFPTDPRYSKIEYSWFHM